MGIGIFKKIGDGITTFNRLVFSCASYLIYPLIAVIVYEVVMRRLFMNPTTWSLDAQWIFFGAFAFLGGAYDLELDAHVKADVFVSMLPKKARAIINALGKMIFFFPLLIAMIYSSRRYFYSAWVLQERLGMTAEEPLSWPSKFIMFFSYVMILAQGLVAFAKVMAIIFEKGEVKSSES